MSNSNEAVFRRMAQVKSPRPAAAKPLGQEMVWFFKNAVEKRQTKLGRIAERWGQLIPETLLSHCALESLHRGTLTVLVDSSSHLYEIKQLLLAGLEKQLTLACKSAGLRKISLKPGRWYQDSPDGPRVTFQPSDRR